MPATAAVLACVLVLAACGGATSDRRAATDPGVGTVEPADAPTADQPHASGAAEYAPPDQRVPEGAIDRALLDRVLAAGPGWLLSEVPLQPTFLAKHKFGGFKLQSVFHNNPKVLRYGILPGDIVRSINGQPLATPSDLLLIFQRLKAVDVLVIAVTRNGVDRQFQFPVVPSLGLSATDAPPSDATSAVAP